jgi:hypothetical protein
MDAGRSWAMSVSGTGDWITGAAGGTKRPVAIVGRAASMTGPFHECGMPCRTIHERKVQPDDEVLQLQVPTQRRQSADLARHH